MIDTVLQSKILTASFRSDPDVTLDTDFVDALHEVLDEVEQTEIRVLVLRSDRKSFCAGADSARLRAWIASPDGDALANDDQRWDALFSRIETLPIPVIAEIDGAALGAGLGLTLACDIRVVSQDAALGAPEARFGLLPAGGTIRRLLRETGPATARDLLLCGKILKGEAACAAGLADHCLPAVGLRDAVRTRTSAIAALDPVPVAAAKKMIRLAATPEDDSRVLRDLIARPAAQQALTALIDRVAPSSS